MKQLLSLIIAIVAWGSASAQTKTIQTSAFTVSTTLAQEFRDAICSELNYQDSVIVNNVKIKNPQTKAQFAQAQLDKYTKDWAKNILLSHRRRQAEASVNQSTPGLEN